MRVIFACVHNAGRSQMAAAFFNQLCDPNKYSATSAGTQPANAVHPNVVKAMESVGIDLSGMRPQKLTDDLTKGASLLVTMGCGEECPYVPGLRRLDWPLPDPKNKSEVEVSSIRDAIKAQVISLLRDLDAVGVAR